MLHWKVGFTAVAAGVLVLTSALGGLMDGFFW